MASWLDLPQDLLDLVVAALPDPADRARCRAVCRTWHSAIRRRGPQAQQLPWIVHFDGEVIAPPNDRSEYFASIPDNASCRGSNNDWLLLRICQQIPEDGQPFRCDNYVLHNVFSLENVPLPELDATLHHAYYVRKFLMRSTVHDFIVVITTNMNTPFMVILPGKGVWLAEPGSSPYIYIVDIAFLGDKLYGITKAENLIPFDLGLDEDGSPMVTIGRRVIRQPLDYEGYEWWPASDDDNSDLESEEEEEEGEEEEEVAVGVADDDEEVADVAIVSDDEQPAEALNVLLDDYDEDGQAVANDDDDGRDNINFCSCPHDDISDDEIIIWHLVESRGKLLMVKPRMHRPQDFSTPSIRKVEVFQADVDTGEWVAMANGLDGGQALFIGRGFSKSISAPCGDVAEGDIYFIESGEVFNIKTLMLNLKRFREPFYWGTFLLWLFPRELVL
ncbi:hypothetical protein ACQ4PT_002416 [Festuca glaucescens]